MLTVNITRKPVANAGSSKTITLPTNSTTLIGSATDPDGDTFRAFRWKYTIKPDGAPNPTLTTDTWGLDDTVKVSNLREGVYTFSLVVIDSKYAASNSSTVTVTVNPAPTSASTNGQSGTRTVNAYPVPFTENLTVDLGKKISGNVSFAITNHLGKSYINQNMVVEDRQSVDLNIGSQIKEPGIYYLQIKVDNSPYKIMRIVKNQ